MKLLHLPPRRMLQARQRLVRARAFQDSISAAQRRLRPGRLQLAFTTRTEIEYRRLARWWELEARRGYSSTPSSLRYARNMRWAAELARAHGPGTWPELIARAGVKNPEAS